jgi:hypothetical protein
MTDENTWLRRHRGPVLLILLTLLLGVIEVSYVAIVTAGRFTTWPTWNTNYDLLAEGFRSGHLYLAASPNPELLAKANPFDPRWRPLWFWDASLHDGHYYLYWGPLPAVAIAIVKTVFRIRGTVGDQVPLFAAYTINLVAGALLIVQMARRLFARPLPAWLIALCIAVFAYANPTPYLIATPGIYEAAIAGGQAFLVLGLLLAFEALWRDDTRARRRLLAGAGLSWGLAFACRASAVLPAAVFTAATALAVAPPSPWRRAWRAPARPLLWMAAPIAAIVAAHLAYNKLRFDGWLDFGLGRQLSTMQFRTAPGYLLPNLYSYLLRPLHPSCRFPFVSAPAGLEARAFPSGFPLPRGYAAPEPVAGLLNATPWVLLAGAAAVLVVALVRRARRAPGLVTGGDRPFVATLWCGVVFLALGTVTGLPTITEFFASMRFLADVAGGLVLAGVWAAFLLYARARDQAWPGRVATAALVALGAASIVTGLLLGVQGYDQMFQRHNPELFARWVRTLSRC